jgi:hypothetical protein
MSIFSEKGHDAAVRDQENNALANEFGNDSDPDFEIKPFTVKAAKFQLEIIDAVAQHFGMTRSDLVKTLVLNGLGGAFVDYEIAYRSAFGDHPDDQSVLDSLSGFFKGATLSDRARKVLSDSVLIQLGLHDHD